MNRAEFIEYFLKFYGKKGLYPIKHVTRKELIRLCDLGITMRGEQFEGDSFDREAIRDMVLVSTNQLGGVQEIGLAHV